MNPVAVTIISPRKEYWPSRGSNQRPAVLRSTTLPTEPLRCDSALAEVTLYTLYFMQYLRVSLLFIHFIHFKEQHKQRHQPQDFFITLLKRYLPFEVTELFYLFGQLVFREKTPYFKATFLHNGIRRNIKTLFADRRSVQIVWDPLTAYYCLLTFGDMFLIIGLTKTTYVTSLQP